MNPRPQLARNVLDKRLVRRHWFRSHGDRLHFAERPMRELCRPEIPAKKSRCKTAAHCVFACDSLDPPGGA